MARYRAVIAVGVFIDPLIAVVVVAVADLAHARSDALNAVIAVAVARGDAVTVAVTGVEGSVVVVAIGWRSAGAASVAVIINRFFG